MTFLEDVSGVADGFSRAVAAVESARREGVEVEVVTARGALVQEQLGAMSRAWGLRFEKKLST